MNSRRTIGVLFSLLVLSAWIPPVSAATAPWPDAYKTRTIELAPPLKPLTLVTFEGKPLIGAQLRTLPDPQGWTGGGDYYADMAEAYVTLLAVIARQRKEPAYLKPVLGAPDAERRFRDFAMQFLTLEEQARFLACPGGRMPNSTMGCKLPVDGTLKLWKGSDEFEREDSYVAFVRAFETAVLGSVKRLPTDMWHLFPVRLSNFDANQQVFKLDRPDKVYPTLPKNAYTTTLIGITPSASPVANYPRQIAAPRDKARQLIEAVPDRKAAMLVELHFALDAQTPEASHEDQRLRTGAARLYASATLGRLLHRFPTQ